MLLDMLFPRFYVGDSLYLALEKNTKNEDFMAVF